MDFLFLLKINAKKKKLSFFILIQKLFLFTCRFNCSIDANAFGEY
jgi:hypothetical protein